MRVNFNYFISEAVFEFILDAVDLVATDGWRLLPDYAFEPATGLWRHRPAVPEPPASACATSATTTDGWTGRPTATTSPSRGSRTTSTRRVRSSSGPVAAAGLAVVRRGEVGPDFEALRWFLAPGGGGGRGRPRPWLRPGSRPSSGSTSARAEAKAALLGLDGRLLGLGRAGYPLDGGPDGRAEQDPRDWWRAVGRRVPGDRSRSRTTGSRCSRCAASARGRPSR